MSLRVKAVLYIALGVIVVLAILLITGVLQPFKTAAPQGKILIWDNAERNRVFADFFSQYQSQFPGIEITYEVKNPDTYERELLDALAAGHGPDIFVLETTSIGSQQNKIAPLSSDDPSAVEFLSKAPDVVLADLIDSQGNIYGIPWSVDTLALYYNKDYLNAANIPEPPRTWDKFQEDSLLLTRLSPTGMIQRSGASLGFGRNVTHAPDIFSALVLQSGNPIFTQNDRKFHLTDSVVVDGESRRPAVSALGFYTDFANPNSTSYTWNSAQPESLDAFAIGRAAFFVGYARDLPLMLGKNAHLNFGIAPLPQLASGERTSYASYEFFTVSRSSRSPAIAWSILISLYQKDVAKPMIEALALPPAHRDLVASKPPNKILQPFYDQVLSARSWRIPNRDAVDRIFRDMLDTVVRANISPGEALQRAESQLQLLVDRQNQQ